MASPLAAARVLLGFGLEGRRERKAHDAATEAAEEVEKTVSIVLCDYLNEEEAADMSVALYGCVFSTTYEALMRRFSARHVRFRKGELAREVSEQVAEEIGMIASICMSDYIDTEKAIEGGERVKEDVRIAVYDAIMRNF
ncbi:MAG: hypothetical protein ACXQS5_04245 [Candidatus Methanospirareceae archaeon]